MTFPRAMAWVWLVFAACSIIFNMGDAAFVSSLLASQIWFAALRIEERR